MCSILFVCLLFRYRQVCNLHFNCKYYIIIFHKSPKLILNDCSVFWISGLEQSSSQNFPPELTKMMPRFLINILINFIRWAWSPWFRMVPSFPQLVPPWVCTQKIQKKIISTKICSWAVCHGICCMLCSFKDELIPFWILHEQSSSATRNCKCFMKKYICWLFHLTAVGCNNHWCHQGLLVLLCYQSNAGIISVVLISHRGPALNLVFEIWFGIKSF